MQRAAAPRMSNTPGHSRPELEAKAKARQIEGRSKMSKRQLENAPGPR
jgi:hypothetical protein